MLLNTNKLNVTFSEGSSKSSSGSMFSNSVMGGVYYLL